MRLLAGAAGIAVFAAGCAWAGEMRGPASPQADIDCKFRTAVAEVGALDKMPKPIADMVLAKVADGMAARGGYFNKTDVAYPHTPDSRFIRAGKAGDKWFLWFERGGFTYSKQIVVFALDGSKPRVLAHLRYFGENPCILTGAILDGHRPPKADQTDLW